MNFENDISCNRKSFKDVFKFYQRKNKKLDLSYVYDFSEYDKTCHFQDKIHRIQVSLNAMIGKDWETSYGMLDPKDWLVFTFNSKPGLIFIKNPFKVYGQRYWIVRCLKDYTKKPNHLNIDALNMLSKTEDWWEFCQREYDTKKGKLVYEKLRWATLGYHHNWDTKEYSEELKNEFPQDLKLFCHDIGTILGFSKFNAEAAIINFYHKNSSLNGHTDHSEKNLDAPLFSFSFGQSAIFLIGGKHIDEEPIPLLLQSGDIIIMSKEARLCYHGVPRIIEFRNDPWNDLSLNGKYMNNPEFDSEVLSRIKNNDFWKPFEMYVMRSRINVNIRQVLFSGETKLS